MCLLWKLPVWVGIPAPPLTVTLQSLTTSQNFLNFSAFLYVHVYQSLSRVPLFGTLQTVARQAPLSMDFSRQEYWSGCHALLEGIFPTQELSPGLLHCRWILDCLSHREARISGLSPCKASTSGTTPVSELRCATQTDGPSCSGSCALSTSGRGSHLSSKLHLQEPP